MTITIFNLELKKQKNKEASDAQTYKNTFCLTIYIILDICYVSIKTSLAYIAIKAIEYRVEILDEKINARLKKEMKITKESLDESKEIIDLTFDYISMRENHRVISKFTKIGSTRLEKEVLRIKMMQALDFNFDSMSLMKEKEVLHGN